MINDFANDTTVSEVIPRAGISKLQEMISEIVNWSSENRFHLNPTKCKELRINFTKQPYEEIAVNANNQPFEVINGAKILGATVAKKT